MKKLSSFFSKKLLFPITISLLVFIPLYPKLPLLDIKNTWVYIRLEDLVIALVLLFWTFLVLTKKVTLKTPLTLTIFVFWIIGALATFHGVILIFPTLSNVFSNVALLNFLRRLEYLSLFFIAYQGITSKKYVIYAIWALFVTLLSVIFYGFGQKFLGFPAYLTMNEEFAKGIPIQLSQLSRVPSTFAGHYDLAAYLVLILPIFASLFFGFKKFSVKALIVVSLFLGFVLLFMTVSRISFFVLLLAFILVLILQKKKFIILTFFVLILVTLPFAQSLTSRFGNTVKEIDVLVDTNSGKAIGNPQLVDRPFFNDKMIYTYVPSLHDTRITASPAAFFPDTFYPNPAPLIQAEVSPTGESLPQGTGYINLPLSPITERTNKYFYQSTNLANGSDSAKVTVIFGDFVIKKALAYDLSFTTRFQGEWPKTILAFQRNILFGSGYSSVTLAVDNDYLRILGETGILGLLSFISIFIVAGIYIRKLLPKVESHITRSFVIGFIAGAFGLALNAIFIDVFEASKVAFSFWILVGIVLGTLNLYKESEIDLKKEFISTVTSPLAVIIYLFFITIAFYVSSTSDYFVGDDFTWLRWAADCGNLCPTSIQGFVKNFTEANNFFYRPGTKIYFYIMYSIFWLNQNAYHFVSVFLHFGVAVLLYLLARKVFKNNFLAASSAFIFIILSGGSEAVLWISSTGYLFTSFFTILSILLFDKFVDVGKKLYLGLSVLSIVLGLMFHELGVVAPLLVLIYIYFKEGKSAINKLIKERIYIWLALPLVFYFILRLIANSHWSGGDYSYNLIKLPFNFIGNLIGYSMISILGPQVNPVYMNLRSILRENIFVSVVLVMLVIGIFVSVYKFFNKKIETSEKKMIIFAFSFFVISLLPFLGFGNIASRYVYLASFGIVIVFILSLRSVYDHLVSNGKVLSALSIFILSLVFLMIQTFQLQKIERDWFGAGEITRKLLVSLNKIYTDRLLHQSMQFYFTGVPIRQGEAWVFPVGLPDAVWFTFKGARVDVHVTDNRLILEGAVRESQTSQNVKVFKFNSDADVSVVTDNKDLP